MSRRLKLSTLRRGDVGAWNEARKAHPRASVHFHRWGNGHIVGWYGAHLSHVDLRDAGLSYSVWCAADFRQADLRRADLRKADLHCADLRRANLEYSDLSRANISSACLRGAKLQRAALLYANLSRADLIGTDIGIADLRGACLTGAVCDWAQMNSCNLRGADFTGARMREIKLRWADLRGACLRDANLDDACFIEADLAGADLRGAYLAGADFRSANLTHADLRGANLYHAKLRSAVITDARLPDYQICPSSGSFRGWKRVWNSRRPSVVELEIPADAQRTACLTSRECRADKVLVIKGEGWTPAAIDLVHYESGKVVVAKEFNADIRTDDAPGIHFYLTRQEAEEGENR